MGLADTATEAEVHFNSNLVRLKGQKARGKYCLRLLFQFQSGTIKGEIGFAQQVVLLTFQFQSGTIKGARQNFSSASGCTHFNSNLVRLKGGLK